MSQVYDLGTYRAIVKGVQEFFMQTQRSEYADSCCKHDTSYSIDLSCKQDDTKSADNTLSSTAEEYGMPPKGWTAGREATEVKAVRLPKSLLERIAQHVERLQMQFRFGRINEGMAIRDLIEVGLDTVEAGISQPQPVQAPLTTQPALPLALEGVPASQAQPLAPAPQQEGQPEIPQASYAPPGMQNCAANPKHRPYPVTYKECPMCANNRRTRASKKRTKEEQAQAEKQPS